MKLQDDDFTLFGLPPRFALDRAALDDCWRALQARVHPDRFVGEELLTGADTTYDDARFTLTLPPCGAMVIRFARE